MPNASGARISVRVVLLAALIVTGFDTANQSASPGGIHGFSDYLRMVLGGPGRLRFLIQPLAALLLGIRDGRRDAAAGEPPYVLALLFVRDRRRYRVSTALTSIFAPLAIGIVMSLVVQHYVFGSVRLSYAFVYGIALIALPYVVARGLTNRFIQ